MFQLILFFTTIATLLICAIFSLKTFRLNWPLAYKLFSICLYIASAIEIIGISWVFFLNHYKEWSPFCKDNNYWITTFGLIPMYLFYIFAYYEILKSKRQKRNILLVAVIFTLFAIINFIWWQGICTINSYTHITASFIMLFLVFAFFEQIRCDKQILNLKKHPMVWISLGNFIYHLLNIPYLFMIDYLTKFHPQIGESFQLFFYFITIISYSLYIKAFLCPQPQK